MTKHLLEKGEVMENNLFANAKQFAEITGRSVNDIRILCRLQQIPCERTGKEYLIDTEAAIAVLKQRAAEFVGHKYDFIPIKRQSRPVQMKGRSKKNAEKEFFAGLDGLKKDYTRKSV